MHSLLQLDRGIPEAFQRLPKAGEMGFGVSNSFMTTLASIEMGASKQLGVPALGTAKQDSCNSVSVCIG